MKNQILQFASMAALLVGFAHVSNAASVSYPFSFENDGDVSCASPTCGTLTIEEVAGGLKFTIEGNEAKFGVDTDVHEFGFNLNEANFIGSIYLNPLTQTVSGVTFTLTNNLLVVKKSDKAQVAGRNSDFDYVASFGNGGAKLNPVSFFIGASTDSGATFGALTLTALTGANVSTQKSKPDAQFMVHLQSTTGVAESEAVGGMYVGDGGAVVPLPAAAWLLLSGLAGLGALGRRRTTS